MGYGSLPFTLSIMLKTSDLNLKCLLLCTDYSVRIEELTSVRAAGRDGNVRLSSSCLVCIC